MQNFEHVLQKNCKKLQKNAPKNANNSIFQYCFHVECPENEGEFCFPNDQRVSEANELGVRKTELTFIFWIRDIKTVLNSGFCNVIIYTVNCSPKLKPQSWPKLEATTQRDTFQASTIDKINL